MRTETRRRIYCKGSPVRTDDAFWRDFSDSHWESTAAKFTGDVFAPFADPTRLFRALVRACELLKEGKRVPLRWSDGDNYVTPGPQAYDRLPRREDRSFEGYAERMQARTFMLHLNELQGFDTEIWDLTRAFLFDLYERVGLPVALTLCDIYVAQYRRTPFGVHLDGASNFSFGVVGKKTLYLWEPEFYHREMKPQGAVDYRKFIEHSIPLEVGPREVIYWPSRYWHIGEPEAERFCVTMNLAVYPHTGRNRSQIVSKALARTLETEPTDAQLVKFSRAQVAETVSGLPSVYRNVEAEIGEMCSTGALREELARLWTERVTALGFNVSPPLQEAPELTTDMLFTGQPNSLLAWQPSSNGRLLCSANGYSAYLPAQPQITGLLADLARGKTLSMREIMLTTGAGDLSEQAIHRLLSTLVTWRAVSVSA